MNNNDQPAFPVTTSHEVHEDGMTLRDWFAGQALAGILAADPSSMMGYDDVARSAWALADAMMKERERE